VRAACSLDRLRVDHFYRAAENLRRGLAGLRKIDFLSSLDRKRHVHLRVRPRSATKLLTKDEARRIAMNIAKECHRRSRHAESASFVQCRNVREAQAATGDNTVMASHNQIVAVWLDARPRCQRRKSRRRRRHDQAAHGIVLGIVVAVTSMIMAVRRERQRPLSGDKFFALHHRHQIAVCGFDNGTVA